MGVTIEYSPIASPVRRFAFKRCSAEERWRQCDVSWKHLITCGDRPNFLRDRGLPACELDISWSPCTPSRLEESPRQRSSPLRPLRKYRSEVITSSPVFGKSDTTNETSVTQKTGFQSSNKQAAVAGDTSPVFYRRKSPFVTPKKRCKITNDGRCATNTCADSHQFICRLKFSPTTSHRRCFCRSGSPFNSSLDLVEDSWSDEGDLDYRSNDSSSRRPIAEVTGTFSTSPPFLRSPVFDSSKTNNRCCQGMPPIDFRDDRSSFISENDVINDTVEISTSLCSRSSGCVNDLEVEEFVTQESPTVNQSRSCFVPEIEFFPRASLTEANVLSESSDFQDLAASTSAADADVGMLPLFDVDDGGSLDVQAKPKPCFVSRHFVKDGLARRCLKLLRAEESDSNLRRYFLRSVSKRGRFLELEVLRCSTSFGVRICSCHAVDGTEQQELNVAYRISDFPDYVVEVGSSFRIQLPFFSIEVDGFSSPVILPRFIECVSKS